MLHSIEWPLVVMSLIPLILVINLEHRRDRRFAMERQLSRIGWHAKFFPAIRPRDAAGFPSIGARGCFLSHLAALRSARDVGVQRLVILEDDVNFAPDFTEQWELVMSGLETREWSIFYAGHAMGPTRLGLVRISPNIGVQCTHFMVINGHAISTLIAGLEGILSRPAGHPLGGPMHLDGAYSTLRSQNYKLTTYAYFPTLGYQRSSRTDVGELKWFDRIGIFAPVVDIARKLREKS
jgi:GR25 family glycosyltransferase involved in LPS biosynthesis